MTFCAVRKCLQSWKETVRDNDLFLIFVSKQLHGVSGSKRFFLPIAVDRITDYESKAVHSSFTSEQWLPTKVADIIQVGAKSVRLNDKKLIYLLLSCGFLFHFAVDYRQKREVLQTYLSRY